MPDDDRWRNDPERYRYRDDDRWGEGAWGYPRGRRGEYRGGGFGAAGRESWYAAGNGDYRPETDRNYGGGSGAERYAEAYRGRGYREDYRGDFLDSERDYGTSAGYGTGGSALDWREVEGGRRREPGFTDLAFGHGFGTGYEGRDWSGPRRERRGNWDYGRERHERGFLERAGDEIASWFGDDEAARRRREDQRGDYRGRGPKGYRRSDERIRDDVNDRFTDDPHIDASNIEVTVSNREVTLSGTIATRFEKRHAEDIADSVSGVTHVQNNLRVQQEASGGAETGLLAGSGRRIGANESSTAGTSGGAGTARRRSTTSA